VTRLVCRNLWAVSFLVLPSASVVRRFEPLIGLLSAYLFLRLCAIGALDAFAITLTFGVQVLLGASIWRMASGRSDQKLSEQLGMGGAIGFSLALMSCQVFRDLIPRYVSWLALPLIAAIGLKIYSRGKKDTEISDTRYSVTGNGRQLVVLATGTLIALSNSWYWLIPSSLVLLSLVAWFVGRESLSKHPRGARLWNLTIVPISVFGFVALQKLTEVETIRNQLWWSLRKAVNEDPDLVFNESMINSVSRFGVADNIFFAGVRLQYHWLSFAWEATLGSLRELQPFAVSGVAAPIFTYLVVLSLVFAIVEHFAANRLAPVLAVLVFAMVSGHQIPLFQIFNPYSFSFNFSLIFVFAFVYILAVSDSRYSASVILLAVLMAVAAVGSKLSTLPFFIFYFGSMLLFSFRKPKLFSAVSRLAVFSAIGVTGFWFFGLRVENSTSAEGFRIDFGEIFVQKANLDPNSPVVRKIIEISAVFLVAIFPLVGVILKRLGKSPGFSLISRATLISGFGSLLLAIVVADRAESGNYLFGMGLAVILPFSAFSLFEWLDFQSHRMKLLAAISAFVGILVSFIWIRLLVQTERATYSNYLRNVSYLLLPLFVAVAFAGLIWIFSKFRPSIVCGTLAIVLVSAAAGSYIANSSDLYALGVNNRVSSDEISRPFFGSDEYRSILTWLHKNSKDDELVATNRQCLTVEKDPAKCLALWSLVSAISKRQNLVEGVWPPFTEYLAGEREKRWGAVIGFVDSPNEANFQLLSAYGVRWVVADHAITSRRDWAPFATRRFSNQAGSILELRPDD